MKRQTLACVILICALSRPVTAQTPAVPAGPAPEAKALAVADAQFHNGNFAAAKEAYTQVLSLNPKSFRAITRLGYLALLSNRLPDARTWLERARKLDPASPIPNRLLAESYNRQDEFAQTVPLLRASGEDAHADQLASFAGQTPYAIKQPQQTVTLKFVKTDPLPVVQVRVNGGAPVNFFIDTGASELTLDSEYARQIGAREFGGQTGTFAGGKQAPFERGRADSVILGGMEVRNLPIIMMPVRPLSPIFGGLRVDGIIGTVLLYHFLATLDYPGGRLVLAPKGQAIPTKAGSITVPFWMAGDHFMVANGTLNGGTPRLFLVDTGLAGGGFSAPEETLTQAGITLDSAQAGQGLGGGGAVQVVPFTVDTLTLGRAVQHHVRGLFSGPFPLEDALGFHLNGLISHGFFRSYALTLDFTRMQLLLR